MTTSSLATMATSILASPMTTPMGVSWTRAVRALDEIVQDPF